MKRYGHMMYPKRRKASAKPVPCDKCKKMLSPSEACYYVDGCNTAITDNSPPYCKECYQATYR